MEESSDCTAVFTENSTDVQGTVFDDTIDFSATRFVKIGSIQPKIREASTTEARIEDFVVLDDDNIVLLVKINYGKMLQLFSREYDYLNEVAVSSEIVFIFQMAKDKLAMVEKTSSRIELCSIQSWVLKLLWKYIEFTLPNPVDRFRFLSANRVVYNGDIFGTNCQGYSDGNSQIQKDFVVIWNKIGKILKHLELPICRKHSQNQDESFFNHCVGGFLALDDNNSLFYHVSWPRRIQCVSFFGVVLWKIDDMGTGLGLDNSLVLGMEKYGNKLCCYMGDSVLTFDIKSRKSGLVKLVNEKEFDTVSKYVTSIRDHLRQSRFGIHPRIVPNVRIGLQYKGARLLVPNTRSVDVYSMIPL